jgi:hypothetical protein
LPFASIQAAGGADPLGASGGAEVGGLVSEDPEHSVHPAAKRRSATAATKRDNVGNSDVHEWGGVVTPLTQIPLDTQRCLTRAVLPTRAVLLALVGLGELEGDRSAGGRSVIVLLLLAAFGV